MNLGLGGARAPPEICNHPFNLVDNGCRNSEVGHGVGRYSLDNGFNQNFPASFREKFILPPINLFSDPVSEVPKLHSFASQGKSRETQIEVMTLASGNAQDLLNIVDVTSRGEFTEGDGRFTKLISCPEAFS